MGILSRFWGDEEKEEKDAKATGTDQPAVDAPPEPVPPPGPSWDFDALSAPPISPPEPAPPAGFAPDPGVTRELEPKIVETLKTVFDPEIPVDIYELGLIYDIEADSQRRVYVKMTLTSPACPSAQQLPSEVRYKIKAIPGVSDATVDVVWDPPWDKDRMSETARLMLGMF